MEEKAIYPQRHPSKVMERASEKHFEKYIPDAWLSEKPIEDYGIDRIITPAINGQIPGINFSVQLKSTKDAEGKLATRLEKTTLRYLLNRLEPVMLVFYDGSSQKGYWKWLLPTDFDLSRPVDSYSVRLDAKQELATVNWDEIADYVQQVFKIKNRLLTAQEYDLFNSASEQEARAWSHYFRRNFAEAALHFTRLAQQEDRKVIWLTALARCQYEEYDYRNALVNINKALDCDTSDDILLLKGSILAEDGIRGAERRKIIEANRIFGDLFERRPSAENAYNYANTLSHINRMEEAINMYRYGLERQPNYAQAWKNLGQVYGDLGDHEQEMDCYGKALQIDPELLQARICRAVTVGRIYLQYDEAIATILDCIATSDLVIKEYPNVYYSLGVFLARMDRRPEAVHWLTKGLDYDPGNHYLLRLKAQILHELAGTNEKRWTEEAILFFKMNYSIDPKEYVLFFYWCSAVASSGATERAVEMALDWLQDHVFAELNIRVIPADCPLEQALLLIKNYAIIRTYTQTHPVEDIRWLLGSHRIPNLDAVTKAFQVQRLRFLAALADRTGSEPKEGMVDWILILFNDTFIQIRERMVANRTETTADETDVVFEVQQTLTVVVKWCVDEAGRCVEQTLSAGKNQETVEPIMRELVGPFLTAAFRHFNPLLNQQAGLADPTDEIES